MALPAPVRIGLGIVGWAVAGIVAGSLAIAAVFRGRPSGDAGAIVGFGAALLVFIPGLIRTLRRGGGDQALSHNELRALRRAKERYRGQQLAALRPAESAHAPSEGRNREHPVREEAAVADAGRVEGAPPPLPEKARALAGVEPYGRARSLSRPRSAPVDAASTVPPFTWVFVMALGIGIMAASVAAFREPNHAIMGLGMSVVFVGAALRHRMRRAAAPSAEALLQEDTRPPVLYLRSYADESVDLASDPYYADESLLTTFGHSFFWSRYSRRRSLEETFANRLGRLGPVIAIGSPRDKTKILGAARLSIDPAVWQETVLRLLRESRLVVLRIGQTPGVMWEMEQAARIVSPERLVLYADFAHMAGEGPKRTVQRRAAFQADTRRFLREEIPLATLRRRFITFERDGRARGTNSLTTAVRRVQGKRGLSPARIAAVAGILFLLAPIPWMLLRGGGKLPEPLAQLVVVEPARGACVPTLEVRVMGRVVSPGFHFVLVNGMRATLTDGAFEALVRAPGEGPFPIEVQLRGQLDLQVDRTVIVDRTAPVLEIAEPSAADVIVPPGATRASIRGHVRDENPGAVIVTADGRRSQAPLEDARSFSAEVVLDEHGAATVVVVADDLAGNRSVPVTLRFGRSK